MALPLIARPFAALHPHSVPAMSRRNYRRELFYSLLFSTALAAVEGGIVSVIVNNAFHDVAPEVRLSYIVALLMAVRAFEVLRVAVRPVTAAVPAPWGGDLTFRAGAVVFFVVTVIALGFIVRAAWSAEESR